MSDFQKDFDTLLNAILTDYRNQFPEADTSQGSLIFIKSACLASALWGLYKYQDWIAQQIFPDTSNTVNLVHHAWVRGLERRTGETDDDLLSRLLDYIRRPPAGGNKYDYVKWALEVDNVKAAWCIPIGQGPGTVDVLILASGGNEIPDQALLDAVLAYIEDVRPVTASIIRVMAPTIVDQDVTMTVAGSSINTAAIEDKITFHLNSLTPGDDLTIAKLTTLAMNEPGVEDVTITVPAGNVLASPYETLRPGTISVSAV